MMDRYSVVFKRLQDELLGSSGGGRLYNSYVRKSVILCVCCSNRLKDLSANIFEFRNFFFCCVFSNLGLPFFLFDQNSKRSEFEEIRKSRFCVHMMRNGFYQFILKPVKMMIDCIMKEKKDVYEPLVKAFRIRLPNERFDRAKDLMKVSFEPKNFK